MTSSINNLAHHFCVPRDRHQEVLPYMCTMFINKHLGIYKASMDYLFLHI